MNNDPTCQAVLEFLVEECGLDDDNVGVDTPLFSSKRLNSLDILKLVFFMEEQFKFSVDPLEIGLESLDTLSLILSYIEARRSGN